MVAKSDRIFTDRHAIQQALARSLNVRRNGLAHTYHVRFIRVHDHSHIIGLVYQTVNGDSRSRLGRLTKAHQGTTLRWVKFPNAF